MVDLFVESFRPYTVFEILPAFPLHKEGQHLVNKCRDSENIFFSAARKMCRHGC